MASNSNSNKPNTNVGQKKQYVIVKQDKFATVGGGLGAKPKVYNSMKAAQHDVDSNAKLKGGSVRPYGGEDGTVSTPAGATPAKTKAAVTKATKKATNSSKRAAAGK